MSRNARRGGLLCSLSTLALASTDPETIALLDGVELQSFEALRGLLRGHVGSHTSTRSLSSCTSIVATVNAGTAAQGDVLSGKTFSSGEKKSADGSIHDKDASVTWSGASGRGSA